MNTILHISADFPDPMVQAKTPAVARLVTHTEGFRHVVYSLNRVNWRSDIAILPFGEDRIAMAYGAPPYGLRLIRHLERVAGAIAADMRRRQIVPDIIHAHKFAVEGIIADRLAIAFGVPFIASLWGDTDSKFFEAKPGLRPHYRRLARRAALLLPPALWTQNHFSTAFGLPAEHFKVLPVISTAEALIAPQLCSAPRVVTVFSWDAWRRKSFDTLLQAMLRIGQDLPDISLDVYGRGGPRAVLEMTHLIERAGLGNSVRLMGALDPSQLQPTMNRYAAFAMPSRRETYGMVYVEAVLAGVPILWPRNGGIDGLFDGLAVGYAADAHSTAEIADALRLMLLQEGRLKTAIARLQETDAFDHVRTPGIVRCYSDLLTGILSAGPQEAASAA